MISTIMKDVYHFVLLQLLDPTLATVCGC